jgi:hypothetical protein
MPSSSLKWRIQRALIFSVLELIATVPFAFVFATHRFDLLNFRLKRGIIFLVAPLVVSPSICQVAR